MFQSLILMLVKITIIIISIICLRVALFLQQRKSPKFVYWLNFAPGKGGKISFATDCRQIVCMDDLPVKNYDYPVNARRFDFTSVVAIVRAQSVEAWHPLHYLYHFPILFSLLTFF